MRLARNVTTCIQGGRPLDHPARRLVAGLAVVLAAAVVVVALGVAGELVAAARAVEPAPVVVVGGAR